jgi:hypothetical protein
VVKNEILPLQVTGLEVDNDKSVADAINTIVDEKRYVLDLLE